MTVMLITNKHSLSSYVNACRERFPFRNTNRSLEGRKTTPLDTARICTDRRQSAEVTLAVLWDEPDYVIFSNDHAVAWHSTTRGIRSRALPPNPEAHEWVLAPNKDNTFNRQHYAIAETVVTTLNKEMDNRDRHQ